MSRSLISVPARLARRLVVPANASVSAPAGSILQTPATLSQSLGHPRPPASNRLFSASTARPNNSPSSSSSPPPSPPPTIAAYKPQSALEPAALSDKQYHALADAYLDRLLVRLEDMQDAREDVDVEYASGVLTLAFAEEEEAKKNGGRARTYVINKQPPNKQIWLSSPVSGPKRYDWVVAADTEDTEPGRWIYLKDGSALDDLLREEIGVDLGEEYDQ